MMKKIKNFIFLLAILTISFALKAQSNSDFDDVTVELTDNGVRLRWCEEFGVEFPTISTDGLYLIQINGQTTERLIIKH